MDGEWMLQAACRGADPDVFFAQTSDDMRAAKRVCRACPVRCECLAEALDGSVESGVWGGMSERERRQLLRRYPQVRGWRRVLGTVADRAGAQAGGRRAGDKVPSRR